MSTVNEKTVTQRIGDYLDKVMDNNKQPNCPNHQPTMDVLKLSVEVGVANSNKLDALEKKVSGMDSKLDRVLIIVGQRSEDKPDDKPQTTQNQNTFMADWKNKKLSAPQWAMPIISALAGGLIALGVVYLFLRETPAKEVPNRHGGSTAQNQGGTTP